MAPARRRSRPSDSSTTPATRRDDASRGTKIPLKGSPRTPHHRSPIKKRKNGISLQQKQALIDNLQLEVTERARRLRAQYNLQAQGLRSRVEIRVNRIPRSLRKLKMGDLLLKHLEQEQSRAAPALPVKEAVKPATRSQVPERAYHTVGNELARDKENEGASLKGKKKTRGADVGTVRPTQVLSPTSSNSRLATRHGLASPPKTQIAQPGSPLKTSGTGRTAAVSGVLSSMVERAKATRYGSTRKATAASSRSSSTTAATRARRPAAAAAKALPAAATRPVTRARASGTSESSEGSTATVVRKAATNTAAVAAAAASKKRTMGVIRKGVAGAGMKKAVPKPAAPATASRSKTTGRTLRKRT
ncbi:hypothetical protein CP532_4386 [Ophiocordyceps camponoti-leonardi (nom. inval.)]|nr:hypothetical protein CP532_4386 [Ophiocordyceps camponoti-leonardi (nom. inval.)]